MYPFKTSLLDPLFGILYLYVQGNIHHTNAITNVRKYLINVQICNGKLLFLLACTDGQINVVELVLNKQFKPFSIKLNDQNVNGLTPFDLAVYNGTLVKLQLLGTLHSV